ncbi:hypothetical protein [Mucilaginibacter sp. PAMB04168]|jgi:hypothetical protein|uniref:hypothetical protein n=1 Tax=Mucilaginibacter sp. PAMB04168 TaxID=3138567 RepID=UPI0031F6E648
MITKIKTLEDVKEFVHQLMAEGLNYHPDDDFDNYVSMQTGDPSYTPAEALLRNQLNDKCFEVCEAAGADIYDISMEIFLKETGLDEFIPLPSQALPE